MNNGEVKLAEIAPRYTFDAAAHVHRLDGKPLMGTSTVVRVIAKPLTWWASGMALTPLGWLNKNKSTVAERIEAADKALLEISDMTRREYSDFLETCYRAHNTRKETAAVTGTEGHSELEAYIKRCIYEEGGMPGTYESDHPWLRVFMQWAVQNVAAFLWSEGHCYSERLWTGGICDCGALLRNGKIAIMDFKSSREAYFDQLVQCGGYAKQIAEHGICDANGNPVYIVNEADVIMVFPFGADATVPHEEHFVPEWTAAFEAAVTLHKLKQIFEKGSDVPY